MLNNQSKKYNSISKEDLISEELSNKYLENILSLTNYNLKKRDKFKNILKSQIYTLAPKKKSKFTFLFNIKFAGLAFISSVAIIAIGILIPLSNNFNTSQIQNTPSFDDTKYYSNIKEVDSQLSNIDNQIQNIGIEGDSHPLSLNDIVY